MAYFSPEELAFAEGYFHITPRGIVEFAEGTPQEIQDRFWKVWPSFHKKACEHWDQGLIDSRYPALPTVDPEENRRHYDMR